MPLTALQVKKAKPGRHADGNGLYLFVKPSGARSWVLRVVVNGRRRDFGLGGVVSDALPDEIVAAMRAVPLIRRKMLTLQEARDKAVAARSLAKAGIDPAAEWKKVATVVPTFSDAARRLHDNIKGGFKSARHSDSWISSLEAYAFPVLGSKPVDQIDTPAIQSVLLPIWLTVPETARRVRQRICAVLDFSHGQGWRTVDAPMRAVAKGLPKQPQAGEHLPAMPYAEVPAFMRLMADKIDTVGRLAVRFTILTAARSGETRGATWDEIDLDAKVWTIPGTRMKAGKPHTAALSDAAVEVLRTMAGFVVGHKGELVFKGVGGKRLSDMTLTKALRDAKVKDYTVHGFRSSFRDWIAEQTSFPGEWAEAALSHALSNKVEAAYLRTKYLDQRRTLMAAWADYLTGTTNVIALADKRA